MSKKLIICVLSVFSTVIYAQKNVDSPYSNYGIGELRPSSTNENRIMGGLQTYNDSIHINLRNPAAYGSLKYTTFAVGATLNQTELSTQSNSAKTKNSTFDYIALAFPITSKMAVGAGLMPYSSVGYKLTSTQKASGYNVNSQYEGKGGVNRGFLSAGYQIYEGWNIGALLNVNFGNTEMIRTRSAENVQLMTQQVSKSTIKGVSYRLGTTYERPIMDKLTLMTSLSYSPEAKLKSNNSRTLSTLEYTSKGIIVRDSKNVDLNATNLAQTDLTMPSELSIGAGVGEDKKWFAGLDYTLMGTQKFANPFIPKSNVTYEDGYELALGGFYIPQYNSFTSYWKRIVYRFGLRYEKTGIVIKNQPINDFGISFGTSLPLKGFSTATIGLEYGRKGTQEQNLVQENYFNIRIGLSFNDKWFQKRKYQ